MAFLAASRLLSCLLLCLSNLLPASATAGTREEVFTVPPGKPGFYRIASAAVTVAPGAAEAVDVTISVQRKNAPASPSALPPRLRTVLSPGTHYEFDPFLGYLEEGDRVICRLQSGGGDGEADLAELRWQTIRTPAIPVARIEATPERTGAVWELQLPHSGFYALDEVVADLTAPAAATLSCGGRVLRKVSLKGDQASLTGELGYLRKGDALRLEIATPAVLRGTLVEWAPRRAPLRVRRGPDGLFDVLEPAEPLTPVDIPPERWLQVAAMEGDATGAIRQALREAGSLAAKGGYAGLRLEAGATYRVASGQTGGAVFTLDGLNRVIFDGRGATLDVRATELERRGVELFAAANVRGVVLADFRTRSEAWNSTFGDILEVSPPRDGNQTVTFRLAAGQASPLELVPGGIAAGYAYDACVPGRLALGTWSHYPPAALRPSLAATAEARVFRHTVTRTDRSIPRGSSAGEPGKWLIKQKKAGVLLLKAGSTAEDVTLCDVVSGGATNGLLRIWGGSGVNVLRCRIEPPPGRWISTSSDGVHGRAREAVWLEDVTIAGVCEDVLNLYATPMGVAATVPGANASAVTLRDLSRNDSAPGGFRVSEPAQDAIRPGDWLVFCDPASGRMLGRVRALEVAAGGRCQLSAPVADLRPWDPARGRSNVMVYNESPVAGLVMRDCEIRDSLRFGAFLKARDCLLFHNQFSGMTGPAIQAANEPEWPEGPFAQNLWLQDNTFTGNAHGYESRHRSFLAVDPAAVAVYARKLGGSAGAGVLTANDIRILDNTFAEWRGVALAVRNARSVHLAGNQFLAPMTDEVVRATLGRDPIFGREGQGRFAAILVEDCSGVRLEANAFYGLPKGDLPLAAGARVTGLENLP